MAKRCCTRNCLEMVGHVQNSIRNYYESLPTYEEKERFLANLVENTEVTKSKSFKTKNRTITTIYKIVHMDVDERVCRTAFRTILDIGEKKITILRKKIDNNSLTDRRGKKEKGRTDEIKNVTLPEELQETKSMLGGTFVECDVDITINDQPIKKENHTDDLVEDDGNKKSKELEEAIHQSEKHDDSMTKKKKKKKHKHDPEALDEHNPIKKEQDLDYLDEHNVNNFNESKKEKKRSKEDVGFEESIHLSEKSDDSMTKKKKKKKHKHDPEALDEHNPIKKEQDIDYLDEHNVDNFNESKKKKKRSKEDVGFEESIHLSEKSDDSMTKKKKKKKHKHDLEALDEHNPIKKEKDLDYLDEHNVGNFNESKKKKKRSKEDAGFEESIHLSEKSDDSMTKKKKRKKHKHDPVELDEHISPIKMGQDLNHLNDHNRE